MLKKKEGKIEKNNKKKLQNVACQVSCYWTWYWWRLRGSSLGLLAGSEPWGVSTVFWALGRGLSLALNLGESPLSSGHRAGSSDGHQRERVVLTGVGVRDARRKGVFVNCLLLLLLDVSN